VHLVIYDSERLRVAFYLIPLELRGVELFLALIIISVRRRRFFFLFTILGRCLDDLL
jgi:hypothetical protein